MLHKLKSLTIFFPFLNDEGTVAKAISDAYFYGKRVAFDIEVIAIHGGKSKDKTLEAIKKQKRKHKDLVIINKTDNLEGYAVIKYGFIKASKDWVFYTDGDLQYHLDELPKLIAEQQRTGADVVNGYKLKREDSLLRRLGGSSYKLFTRILFNLPIRDLDCDFRLIRRGFINRIKLNCQGSSVTSELIKKLELAHAKFAEIPVTHYRRVYSISNYNVIDLFIEKFIGDVKLKLKMG